MLAIAINIYRTSDTFIFYAYIMAERKTFEAIVYNGAPVNGKVLPNGSYEVVVNGETQLFESMQALHKAWYTVEKWYNKSHLLGEDWTIQESMKQKI
jgi:hypothetical protein